MDFDWDEATFGLLLVCVILDFLSHGIHVELRACAERLVERLGGIIGASSRTNGALGEHRGV